MFDPRQISVNRRRFLHQSSGAAIATIAGMSFPRVMMAQDSGSAGPKELHGTVIHSVSGDPQALTPNYLPDDYLWPMACNIYNSLFGLDNSFNVVTDLATGYEISEDGLSITVPIHPDATWHDGTPVTSHDVKYSLEEIVNTPSSAAASLIGAIASVDTPDDKTAVLNLSQPSASVIGFLSWYGVFIIPAHIYEGTDWETNEANDSPIGSGPFKFVSYSPGVSVELAGNADYWKEGPYLESLIYQIIPDPNTEVQALQSGEIDFVPGVPNTMVPVLDADPNFKTSGKVYPSPIYIGFNMRNAPLDDVRVRRAIGMGIDRDQIVATALGGYGTPETHFYPSVIEWASNADAPVPALDIDGANALLDEAGYPMDGDKRFSLRLVLFTGWQEAADSATVFKEQMTALGIEIELVLLEYATWHEAMSAADFDIELQGGFQGPDPAALNLRWGSTGASNFFGFDSAEFDEAMAAGDAAATQEERVPHYFRAQEILAEELPSIPLALQTYYAAFNSKLSGIWLDPDDPASTQVGMNRFTLTKLED